MLKLLLTIVLFTFFIQTGFSIGGAHGGGEGGGGHGEGGEGEGEGGEGEGEGEGEGGFGGEHESPAVRGGGTAVHEPDGSMSRSGDMSYESNLLNGILYVIFLNGIRQTSSTCPVKGMCQILGNANTFLPNNSTYLNPVTYANELIGYKNQISSICGVSSSATKLKTNTLFVLISVMTFYNPWCAVLYPLLLLPIADADTILVDGKQLVVTDQTCPVGSLCDYIYEVSNELQSYIQVLTTSTNQTVINSTLSEVNQLLLQLDAVYATNSYSAGVSVQAHHLISLILFLVVLVMY